MYTEAWRKRTEPLDATQRRGIDSSRVSVPPEASLYNRNRLTPPHYHSNLRWGWRCGMKKVFPMNSSVWRPGKNGRLRVGDDRFTCRKRSSSLLVCGSACSSDGQSIYNLATPQVITSKCSSLATVGAEARRSHIHPPPRMKREAPSPEGKWSPSGLPRQIWWVGKEIGTRTSPFPPTDPFAIPTSANAAPPRQQRDQHHRERWWRLPSYQREPSGSEARALEEDRSADCRCFFWVLNAVHAPLPSRRRKSCVCHMQQHCLYCELLSPLSRGYLLDIPISCMQEDIRELIAVVLDKQH